MTKVNSCLVLHEIWYNSFQCEKVMYLNRMKGALL